MWRILLRSEHRTPTYVEGFSPQSGIGNHAPFPIRRLRRPPEPVDNRPGGLHLRSVFDWPVGSGAVTMVRLLGASCG